MDNIELTNKYVLLKEIKPDTITKSGIYLIPPKWNRKFKVLQSASELVNEGEEVFVEIGKGTEIKLNNETVLIYHECNIMAIVS